MYKIIDSMDRELNINNKFVECAYDEVLLFNILQEAKEYVEDFEIIGFITKW